MENESREIYNIQKIFVNVYRPKKYLNTKCQVEIVENVLFSAKKDREKSKRRIEYLVTSNRCMCL